MDMWTNFADPDLLTQTESIIPFGINLKICIFSEYKKCNVSFACFASEINVCGVQLSVITNYRRIQNIL